MPAAKLRYLQIYRDRHGKPRQYFRRPGYDLIALPGEPGSEAFMAAYDAALSGAPRAPKSTAKPDSIAAMLIAYYRSVGWAELKPKTQATYRAILDRFRERFGDLPADALTAVHVRKMIDAGAAKPGATRTLMKRLRGAYAFALSRGLVRHNPFVGVQLPREGRGFRPWSEADIQRFLSCWTEGTRARLALLLLLHTGQRRSDVVRMGPGDVRNGVLTITQAKGRQGLPPCTLDLPLHPELIDALAEIPSSAPAFLMTAYGKPMSAAGFSGWFTECAGKAGLPLGSSPHGLRKAAARRLAEAGCSAHQIAAVTGHKSLREVERYTQSARQAHLAREAMTKLWGTTKPMV